MLHGITAQGWDSETMLSEIWQDLTTGNIYTNPAVRVQMSEMTKLKIKSKIRSRKEKRIQNQIQ